VAERINQVDVYHGVKVADPYRWLEDLDSPKTQAWIKAQRAYTDSWFQAAPGRAQAMERVKRLWNFDRTPLRQNDGSRAGIAVRDRRIFFLRQTGLENQPVLYVRDTPESQARVLLDVNTLAADGTAALSTWAPSPDGRWLAYGIARAGSDWQVWRIREVASGKDLADQLDWIKFSSPSWSADSRGFYYARYPKPEGNAMTVLNENHKLYHHRIETAQAEDRLVYERPDHKDWLFTPHATEDGRYLVIKVEKGTLTHNLLFYQDLKARDGKTHELISEFFAEQIFLGNRGDRFYVQTTYNAPMGRVVAVDLKNPERSNWREIAPAADYRLDQSTLDGSWLVLKYLKDATGLARVRPLDGGPGDDVPLPANSTITLGENSRRYFSVVSFTSPETIYDCGAGGTACKPFLNSKLPFDPSIYEARQVFYTSKDGTRIPMFLVHRKGLRQDGSHPTLLYGYGGFDISITPDFTPRFLGFLEMGGVLAVANLRGGGEYGEAWHNAGMKHNKQNVFDDFIAAAEWLIANRYTSKSKLAIEGRSNGGLLVGAVLNQRPDLFAAAVPWVGVMDMLRFHKFTIGAAWVSDYGSPDNPEDFRAIYRYSPLHNIREGASYPATLILTADHDDRVVPAHSFKYAAALQRAQGGPAPVLIRIGASAGHGSGKPTSMRIAEDADVLTFLARTLGM
jgi:prolyl oligopeptidase